MEYHLNYKNINIKIIELVRKAIITDRIFKKKGLERVNILINLKNNLCEVYKIQKDKQPLLKPSLKFNNMDYYDKKTYSIYLNHDKLSLITFLHEFKHFLQHHFNKPNNEKIARGYSISLFYIASPRHFKKALQKGLILHQKP